MIKFLNHIVNKLFIVSKYIVYGVVVIIWIITYPFNRIAYEGAKRKSPSAFFNHPNFILLNWIMKVNKYFNKFIF